MENIIPTFNHTCPTCRCANSRWFCYRNQCFYFVGDWKSPAYKVLNEVYYEEVFENDTDYARSDIDVTKQVDRVFKKISEIKGASNSYEGEYIMTHIFKMLEDKMIDSEAIDNIRDKIRKKFRYVLTNRDFRGLCREAREETELRKIHFIPYETDDDNGSLGSLSSVYA